jgi:tetrahydromethanopterin S-methyltransferase subunit G
MLVAVTMPREKWTDERLDDLNKKVDDGFAQVHADIRGTNARIDKLNESVNGRLDAINESVNGRLDAMNESVNARFDAINARFDSLNRNLLAGTVVIIAAMIGSNAL